MNRQPYSKPPKWWSPKPSRFWMRLWFPLRKYHQLWKERILKIDIEGLEHVRRAVKQGYGVMITPNHPGHGDCYLLWEALTRLRRRCYVMTAWQVFQMSRPFHRLVYQHHGCFSVNREGTDVQAFRQALDVLAHTSEPLVIFPEGDVYHLNDRVTPFRDGTGAIAQMAVKRSDRAVACIPCALKYEYLRDPTPELREVMARLEQRQRIAVRRDLPLAERIQRFLSEMVQNKSQQYLGHTLDGSLAEQMAGLADAILQRLEAKFDIARRAPLTIPERVKELRHAIIDRQLAGGVSEPRRREFSQDMDDLFFVVQLFSYPADYVVERPTIERIAETIDKLEEDFLDAPTAKVRGTRRAKVIFGEPVLVTEAGDRQSARQLSDTLAERVQRLLEHSRFPAELVPA